MSSRKGQILTLVRSEGIMRLSACSVNEPAKVKSPLTKGAKAAGLGSCLSILRHRTHDNPQGVSFETSVPLKGGLVRIPTASRVHEAPYLLGDFSCRPNVPSLAFRARVTQIFPAGFSQRLKSLHYLRMLGRDIRGFPDILL